MYLPRHFEEDRIEVAAELLRDHPFATLVSLAGDGLIATHLPLLWDPTPAPFGTLTGHFARPNPHGRETRPEVESLAIFHGPHAYVSPSWYASKREHGKVVPTWNYAVVHAHGRPRFIDDREWLRGFVTALTNRHESGRPDPWQVTDAPADYVESMLGAIVGLEIPITRLVGKWKMSQNRPAQDRGGVVDGLRREGGQAGATIADIVHRHA